MVSQWWRVQLLELKPIWPAYASHQHSWQLCIISSLTKPIKSTDYWLITSIKADYVTWTELICALCIVFLVSRPISAVSEDQDIQQVVHFPCACPSPYTGTWADTCGYEGWCSIWPSYIMTWEVHHRCTSSVSVLAAVLGGQHTCCLDFRSVSWAVMQSVLGVGSASTLRDGCCWQ